MSQVRQRRRWWQAEEEDKVVKNLIALAIAMKLEE
jgi:hypothetical protein